MLNGGSFLMDDVCGNWGLFVFFIFLVINYEEFDCCVCWFFCIVVFMCGIYLMRDLVKIRVVWL